MAGTLLDSVIRENAGSTTLHIATFTTIDDGGTWTSNIAEIVGYWANGTDDPTQTKEGIDVSVSTSTFTFNVGENARTGMLYVLSRS